MYLHWDYLILESMKRIYLITLVCLFYSCAPYSFFNTPNDLQRMKGTLYLSNGDSLKGKLDVNPRLTGRAINIYMDQERKPMQFSLVDVTGYRIHNDYYGLKQMKGGLLGSKGFSIIRRLTHPSSRIHLF